VTHLLGEFVLWSIAIAGIITALQRFFDVTAFLAGLGILGFTIGFALQDIMKNFASGVILLLQQPFHVGDTIGVKGFDGTVLAIDLRATEMSSRWTCGHSAECGRSDESIIIIRVPTSAGSTSACTWLTTRTQAWSGKLFWRRSKPSRASSMNPSRSSYSTA
jgi:small-conductance mechanosensitive channel